MPDGSANVGANIASRVKAKVAASMQDFSLKRAILGFFSSSRMWGLVVLLAALVFQAQNAGPIQFLRSKTFDYYQIIKPREVTDLTRFVTIVDLDDKSFEEVGQWPWPRNINSQLVDRILEMGPLVLGFDSVFSEPDRASPSRIVDTYALPNSVEQVLANLPDNDFLFSTSISSGNVVMGMAPSSKTTQDQTNPPWSSIVVRGHNIERYVKTFPKMLYNLPVLDEAATGRGVFIVEGELDGTVRRVPMVVRAQESERFWPSLSMEMIRVAAGASNILLLGARRAGVEGLDRVGIQIPNGGNLSVPVDENGLFYVYFSHYDREKYVSAVDVLNGTAPPEKFTNKFVLLGTSAVGLLDIKTTPLTSFLPGVEVHANIIENILTGETLQRPREAPTYEFFGTLIVGVMLIILVPMIGARWTLLLLVGIVAGTIAYCFWLYSERLMLYDPIYPALVSVLIYMQLTYMAYAAEEAQRRQVRDAFSRYMSPALVERLAKDPTQLKLGGEMRDMTMMFCDVRGFTTISELFDAEGLTKLINRFLTPMTDVILAKEGTIDKYMGDCIMAFWNAPLDDGRHARNACSSALEMAARLKAVNEELEQEAKEEGRKHIPLAIGIGINSGTVCVGNMGSDQRFDYSVLGDNVNLASRLEGQSKTYGVTTVVGENSVELAASFALLELDLIRVKGKTVPVRIFGLVGDEEMAASEDFKTLRSEHDQMLACYRAQDWGQAQKHLLTCRQTLPELGLDGLFNLYEERLSSYAEASPGEDWDGVFVALTK